MTIVKNNNHKLLEIYCPTLVTPLLDHVQAAKCKPTIMRSINLIPIKGKITPPKPQMVRFLRSSASAPRGRYSTPLRATGMSAGIIKALNITADKIADVGECRCITSMPLSHGSVPANSAGTIAKYFATSLATENVVSEPRV